MPDWITGYRKDWLRPDIIAGLTTAAVVIPKAMAYASIAGLPVQVGLYTAFLPIVIYALLGTSRPLSVSTTTTLAILTAAELGEVVPNGDLSALLAATAVLTLMVGAMLLVASLLRLGFVANFISEPVLIGFKAGIGTRDRLRPDAEASGYPLRERHFRPQSPSHRQGDPGHISSDAHRGTRHDRALGRDGEVSSQGAGSAGRGGWRNRGAYLLGLQAHGVELVGRIPRGLPPFTLPDLSMAADLWPGALGIALMSFTETIAAGRAFAKAEEPPIAANRELLATGLANAGGALLGSMPAGGGTTQTAVNRLAGARTQLAELVTAGVSLATMLLLAPLIGLMPQATLAAIVIVYSIGLIKPEEFSAILQVRRTEFIWALTAFSGVVLVGTLKGILVAIVVSLVALAYQAANPPVYVLRRKPGTNVFRPLSTEHPEDESFPGLLLLKLEGRIFFANVAQVTHKVRPLVDEAKPTVVAIDLSGVPDIEYTVIKMLTEAATRERERGVSLWLVGLNPEVLAVVQRSSLGRLLGREALQFNLETAVTKYLKSFAAEGA